MAIYIVRRLLWVVFLLFVITLITFVVFNVLPAGDPAAARAGRQPSPELIETIREQLGLDDPLPVRFIHYLGDILPFVGGDGVNFGFSYQNNSDVLPQLLSRLPATIFLALGAAVLWLVVAIPIGVISAIKTGSWIDRLSMGVALVAISAPVYFLGLVVLYLFDQDIGRFPLLPGNSAYQDAGNIPEKALALVLPWCVLAASFAAIYARFLRGTLIDTHAGGLRAHRARQGPVGAQGDLQARDAGGDHADRDAARARHRPAARRRDPHRDGVQRPGDRPLRLRGRSSARTCRSCRRPSSSAPSSSPS